MYREIKFRVWDKDYKRMHTVGDFHHDSLEIDEENNIFFFNLQCMEGSPHKGINPEECAYRLMQYTGLKDKNGKEIYEGDIVKTHKGYLMKVHWYNNGFKLMFKFKRKYQGEEYWETTKDIELDSSDDKRWGYEVIGNIYENPELLEEGE